MLIIDYNLVNIIQAVVKVVTVTGLYHGDHLVLCQFPFDLRVSLKIISPTIHKYLFEDSVTIKHYIHECDDAFHIIKLFPLMRNTLRMEQKC